jgi:hypothetical protein
MLTSPRLTARIAGLFYLLMMLVGGVAAFARQDLVVKNNAAATATAIMAHQSAFIVSFAGEIFVTVFYLVVVALLYRLLKPVNPSVALVDAFFGLTGCIVQASATAFMIAPLAILGRADYLSVFRADQLQAMSYMFLRVYSQTYGIAIIFFAFYCLIAGYLIYRSTFLPRIIGVLLMIAGAAWRTFLSPPFGAAYLRPYIMPFAIGEAVLTLWLLVKGVDAERWKESAQSTA